jgi:hypothetical protein
MVSRCTAACWLPATVAEWVAAVSFGQLSPPYSFRMDFKVLLRRAQWVVVREKQHPQPARFYTGASPILGFLQNRRWHFVF